MKDRLTEALRRADADYAEIRFEQEDQTQIAYRGEEVEHASSGKMAGGIVRACVKGGWGVSTFDSLDDLDHRVAEACESARLVGRETTELAEVEPVDRENPADLDRDFRGVPMDEKLALLGRYNDLLLGADESIMTTMSAYREKFRRVHFASTRGAYFMDERPSVTAIFLAVARDGGLIQQAHDSAASATSFDAVLGLEEMVTETGKRAAALLKAPSCEAGKTTAVLDPKLGGVFAHEAFGHLSEADFLHENPKMRDLMHLGREMGVKELNIYDDGSLGQTVATHPCDDEGTPTGRTMLIENGVLAGHLHSLETAAKMGEKPTGNARAIGRGFAPIVRMTNTCIAPGDKSFDELIGGIDNGIYACNMFGGQTMMEMFTFSAAYGYRIENGQLGELVRDVVLTGNVFETLNSIDGFGDDFTLIEAGGGCGKGGQSPLPVTFGSPHLRIRDVVVGGQ